MPRIIWFATLVSLLSPSMVSSATADNHQCQVWSHNPPYEPKEGQVDNGYGGVVTEVTKESITIQWVNSPGEKPKKFPVSETLAAGKVPIEPRRRPSNGRTYKVEPDYMYRLTDVKVGDCVGICYARIGGVDICDHIRIWRRPDGLVPPLPKEAEDLRDLRKQGKIPDITKRPYVPYHEFQNAYWARQAPMPREVKLATPNISP